MANEQPSPRVVLIPRQQILQSAYAELLRFELQQKQPRRKPFGPFGTTMAIGFFVLLCLLLALHSEAHKAPAVPQSTSHPVHAPASTQTP